MRASLTHQEIAVCRLVGVCEGLARTGLLPEKTEMLLRERIVETCNAFGLPTIAERGAIVIGDGDQEIAQ